MAWRKLVYLTTAGLAACRTLVGATVLAAIQGRIATGLANNGWIDGEWGVTSNNRKARIYKITARGRKQLTEETERYRQLTRAIARVMETE